LNQNLLILFTRYPERGRTKTRLIPVMGATESARLQRELTIHILQVGKDFSVTTDTDFVVYYNGPHVKAMQQILGAEFYYEPQSEGDLGHRMFSAFASSLGQGRSRVVLIGSDCPGITGKVLESAFSRLKNHDLVLGPATDGGYYLIGLTAPYPELFQDMPWGTNTVLVKTQTKAEELGLRTAFLEPLTDIDRPEDLHVWENILR
jgi:uncharacterized protein